MKKFSAFVVLCAVLAATSIFSCKQTAKGNETPKPVKIASISVKPTITLKKGETSTLKATILPKEAPQDVKWESDKPAIVSVDEKGVITAKELGTANIKVTSLKDATKTATCVVTVAETYVAVTEIKLPTTTALKKGDTSELNFKVLPKEATDKNVECTSDAPDKVSVDENSINVDEDGNGKVKITAKEVGEATITVSCKTKSEDGSEKVVTAKCKVTVTITEVALKELKLDPTDITLKQYERGELKVTLEPENTTDRNVEWKSKAPENVSIDEIGDDGKVKITAKKVGTADIEVSCKTKSEDGTEIVKTATCKVTVEKPVPVDSVSLDKNVLELAYENSETLKATVNPDTASQEVIWSSSDETVATCSPNGVVTAKKKTVKITITAASKTDPSKKATCTVYVAENKVERLSFKENSDERKKSIEMMINTEAKFDVYALPEYASYWMNYEVETGSVVKMEDFYRRGQFLYTGNLRAGDLPSNLKEKEEKITIRSEVRPDLEAAVLTIKVVRPKVTKITVQNKEIGLTDYAHKMEAIVFPQKAWQKVEWKTKTDEDEKIVGINANGLLSPRKDGTATIVATATDGSGVQAEATVVVNSPQYGVGIDKSAIYYGSGDATLTIKPSQAGSSIFYDFEMESDKPSDLKIAKVEERVFKIWVKNKKARTAEAKLTIKSKNYSDATRYAYINIKTIIPEAISIEGDDKMYLNETLRFDIDTTKKDASHPEPNKNVRWEWDNSYSTSGVGASDFEITQNGTVRLRSPSSNQIGKSFRIKAILDLDNSVVATKVITIYRNIAKITNARMLTGEWSMCDRENEIEHNGLSYSTWGAVLCELESLDNIYNKFVVSEESSPTDIPESSYFESTKYDAEERQGKARIQLSYPKGHTSSKHVTFYVWPIDPKTEKPAIVGQNNTFDFRIWAKPTGIEFRSVNFAIEKYKDDVGRGEGWRSTGYINEEYKWKRFEVRVVPQHANPNLLKFTTKKGREEDSDTEARWDCITREDPVTLSDPDGSGWRACDFKLRKKTGWYRNRTDFCFCLALSPASYTTDAKIKAYMHVIQDSGW